MSDVEATAKHRVDGFIDAPECWSRSQTSKTKTLDAPNGDGPPDLMRNYWHGGESGLEHRRCVVVVRTAPMVRQQLQCQDREGLRRRG